MGVEQARHDKMKKRPEFCNGISRGLIKEVSRTLHRILNGGTGKEKTIPTVELEEDVPSSTATTLDSLCLIKDHVLPFETLQIDAVGDDEIVRGDDDMEGSISVVNNRLLRPEFAEGLAIGYSPPIRNDFEVRYETGQLLLPVVKS